MSKAQYIHFTGSVEEVEPKKGARFSLEELQKFVGGYIEPVYLRDGRLMWVNEEGLLANLPINFKASELAGKRIVGNVLVTANEPDEDDEGDD